jgi:hypothetical protein
VLAIARRRHTALAAGLLLGLTCAPWTSRMSYAANCQFALGFARLHDAIPNIVGSCLDNEAPSADGAVQHTTRGLLAWRLLDNWTAFTDGASTWISGPNGLVSRPNSDRFPWEAVDTSVTIDHSKPVGVSQLALGVTHGQHSIDADGSPHAIGAAENVLRTAAVYQNQHIMGWGADNPEPAPGTFSWDSLDNRMALITATGGIPVITLCCAPDWMKGGTPGQTDWNQLEAAPLAAHFGDFAELARQVALRYPQIRYFQVWNELKGFYNSSQDRPDYEGYTALYNAVYRALKSVNPAIQVGGPYVILYSTPDSDNHSSALKGPYGTVDQRSLDTLSYWLDHKAGADFVAIDASSFDAQPSDAFAATQKFTDVMAWVRNHTNLPVWWSEWYVSPWGGSEWSAQGQNAVMASALIRMLESGAAVALRWQPQADPNRDDESLWTDTSSPDGGAYFPFFNTMATLRRDFGPGTALYQPSVTSSRVDVLATASKTLLVNKTPSSLTVRLNGAGLSLAPFEVREA